MDWQVDGADRETGEDKAFLIDADTEQQARAIAEAHGLYVSAAAPYVDPNYTPSPQEAAAATAPRAQETLPYARPGASAAAATFADVPGAARRLRAADIVLSIFGWLYVALGVIAGLLILFATLRLGTAGLEISALLTTLVLPLALIAVGVVLLGAGAALRMLAAIGVATTEIARRKQ